MQEKRTRRTFSPEFKKNAVDKVLVEGRPIAEVARDLDINRVSLDNWIKAARADGFHETDFSKKHFDEQAAKKAEAVDHQEAPAEAAPEAPVRKTLTLKPGVNRDKGGVRIHHTNSPAVEVINAPMAYVAPDPNDLPAAFAQVKDEGKPRPTPLKRPEPEKKVVKPALKNLGARWSVQNAFAQCPDYVERNQALGYKDSFAIPASSLEDLWNIVKAIKEKDDKEGFAKMVAQEGLTVSEEVLANPRLKNVENDNRQFRKPWQKPQARLDPVAQDFFRTTPDYARAVYEQDGPITIRLAPFAETSPVLQCEGSEATGWTMTVDFSKFDRFVDEFYGDFVNECKTILMQHNPKEYHSLNAFIRYPDQPAWNPKLWAGETTFRVAPGESFAMAWLKSINAV